MSETAVKWHATVDDLYSVDGKAELVNGRLRIMEPAGDMHGRGSTAILVSLYAYARATRAGVAYGDNVGFLTDLPHRHSFSPDAAYYTGPPAGRKFLPAPPVFAVEVRSDGDYGPAAEREMADKRRDYFAAGTLVVWDVDLFGAQAVRVFRDGDADTPSAIFRRDEEADAEPAVPGWRFAVDDLFE
ncbi:MAG TPA: Uma2 family endonuclease [Chloroflexota bacterium]|nr:Uma2 family endonuclease [Chloroflexota bacterium]